MQVRHTLTNKEVLRFSEDDVVIAVYFIPNERLVVARLDGVLEVFDVRNDRRTLEIAAGGRSDTVAVRNDGALLAAGSSETGFLGVWDLATGRQRLGRIQGFGVSGLVFSPDNNYIALSGSDQSLHLLDSRGVEKALLRHNDLINSAAFSSDGRHIVTASGTNARIWNIASGIEEERINIGTLITAGQFSEGGEFVISSGTDGSARVWKWHTADTIRDACLRVGRNLFLREWKQYLGNEEYSATCPSFPTASASDDSGPSENVPAPGSAFDSVIQARNELLHLADNISRVDNQMKLVIAAEHPSESAVAGQAVPPSPRPYLRWLKDVIQGASKYAEPIVTSAVLTVMCVGEKGPENEVFRSLVSTNNVEGLKSMLSKYPPRECWKASEGQVDDSPIHAAARNGNQALIQVLIDRGVTVDYRTRNGTTPLIIAAMLGNRGLVEFLLSKGANANAKSKTSETGFTTPLLAAAVQNHLAVAQMLLQHGADPNLAPTLGADPLWMAGYNGHTEMVRLLLESGAKPTVLDIKFLADNGKIDLATTLLRSLDPIVANTIQPLACPQCSL